MPTRDEVWQFCLEFFVSKLEEYKDKITVSGKTVYDRYGLTHETLQKYQIGFAPADISLFNLIKKHFSLENLDIISANGFGLISIPQGGVFQTYNIFNNALMLPYLNSQNQPAYWCGRITDLTNPNDYAVQKKMKYRYLSHESCGITERPIYLEPDLNQPVIAVEGQFQALKLRQEGFNATAVGGNPNQSHLQTLARAKQNYFLPDTDKIIAEPEHFTGDKDGGKVFKPAVTREEKLEKFLNLFEQISDLAKKANLKQPVNKLCTYPAEFENTPPNEGDRIFKGDVNDFWNNYPEPQKAFLEILQTAADTETLEISSIRKDLSLTARSEKISALMKKICWNSPMEQSEILTKLQKHLGLKHDQIQSLKKEIVKHQDAGIEPPKDPNDFSMSSNLQQIRPGQFFATDKLMYTVWKVGIAKQKVKGQIVQSVISKPYFITSDFDFFEINETELLKRNLRLKANCTPQIETNYWSMIEGTPFSLPDFLKNPTANTPDTAELYEELRNYFKNYCYFDNAVYYDFMALYILITYCVKIFPCMGFLALNGTKGSGKSNLLDIIASICWFPLKTSSQTAAFLYRALDAGGCTGINDECEQLSSPILVNAVADEKTLIWKDSYKASGGVGRCVGLEQTPYKFETYSCQVFANTKGYEPTFYDRAFGIMMAKVPDAITLQSFDLNTIAPYSDALRNKLHCWTLAHTSKIVETLRRLSTDLDPLMHEIKLRNREREIWTPFVTMAITVDELCGKHITPTSSNFFSTGSSAIGNIIESCYILRSVKQQIMATSDKFPLFLAGLRQMILQKTVTDYTFENQLPDRRSGWYSSKDVTNYLNKLEGLKYFPKKSGQSGLLGLLDSQMGKIKMLNQDPEKGPVDSLRIDKGSGRRQYVRLDLAKIQTACKHYGLPDDTEVELADEQTHSAPGNHSEVPADLYQEQ